MAIEVQAKAGGEQRTLADLEAQGAVQVDAWRYNWNTSNRVYRTPDGRLWKGRVRLDDRTQEPIGAWEPFSEAVERGAE